jgi:hypothetical protein
MSVVFEQVFCVRLPDYKRLQELDKKIKSFPLPPSLRVPGYGTTNVGDEFEQPRVETTLRRLGATAIKELSPWHASISSVFIPETLFYSSVLHAPKFLRESNGG